MGEPVRFHLALNVVDLARSIGWYRDVFGLEPDKRHEGYARFLLDTPAVVLSLNQVEGTGPGNRVSHFGIRHGSEAGLEASRRRVLAAGYEVRDENQTLCCHAIQDKFWVVDPDGNEWEFYQVTNDHPERSGGKAATPPRSCC